MHHFSGAKGLARIKSGKAITQVRGLDFGLGVPFLLLAERSAGSEHQRKSDESEQERDRKQTDHADRQPYKHFIGRHTPTRS